MSCRLFALPLFDSSVGVDGRPKADGRGIGGRRHVAKVHGTYVLYPMRPVRELRDEEPTLRATHRVHYVGDHAPPVVISFGFWVVCALIPTFECDGEML